MKNTSLDVPRPSENKNGLLQKRPGAGKARKNKMSQQLRRRDFIGASLLTLLLPRGTFAQGDSKVVLRFAAMSDVHYNKAHTENAPQRLRFAKAIQVANQYSAKQEYDKLDALVVAGDFSDHGVIEEIGPFKKTMDDHLSPETKRVLCMGNHEYYGGNRELWEKTFETSANKHEVINGYHFITVSPEKGTCAENDYVYALEWLEKNLAEAVSADPSRPVFLIQHYHVYNTVFGSHDLPGDFHAGVSDFLDLLRNYPQVVHISGHSHVPSVDPRAVWQGEFTAIGTGSLSYFGLYLYERRFEFHRALNVEVNKAGTFLIFDVFNDRTIHIRLYDTISDSFLDREYLLVDPVNVEKHVYTDKRAESAKNPYWEPNSEIKLTDAFSRGAQLEFTAGKDDQCLTCYRLELDRREQDGWKEYSIDYLWSDYFMKIPSPKVGIELSGLRSGSRYQARIFGVNTYRKSSEKPLTLEFDTKPDGPYVDRKSLTPQADVFEISFEKGGIVNRAADPRFKTEIRTLGAPAIVEDPTLGFAASFGGADQCYQVPVAERNYQELRTEVTLAATFRVDASKPQGDNCGIVGNTENGGIGFEYRPKSKTLAFLCYFNGKYETVSAPFDGKGDASLFGVYDGSAMILYLNGKAVGSLKQTGRIKYTQTAKARAFCLGGDITPQAGVRFNFPGLISKARLYSWALTPEQIENLSK